MNIEEIKFTPKLACKLSRIIDKMGISSVMMNINIDTGNEKEDIEAVAKEVFSLLLNNLYKAESEVYELISVLLKITPEEAEEVDLLPIIKSFLQNTKLTDFLK